MEPLNLKLVSQKEFNDIVEDRGLKINRIINNNKYLMFADYDNERIVCNEDVKTTEISTTEQTEEEK